MNDTPTPQEQHLHEAYQTASEAAAENTEILTVAIEIQLPVREDATVLGAMEKIKGVIASCKALGPTKADLKLGRKWLPLA